MKNAPDPSFTLILRGISLPYKEDEKNAFDLALKRLAHRGVRAYDARVFRRSVDARKRNDVRFVYTVAVKVDSLPHEWILRDLDAAVLNKPSPDPEPGKEIRNGRIVIVGFGPCGMFCALTLARAGYEPVVIERGDDVYSRKTKVDRFLETGELDTDSNVQFGAGGAGSFSDGKLITRVNDPLSTVVMETYAAFGAPKSILTLAKPHVGTDKLLGVVDAIGKEIARLGGEVRYRTKFKGCRYDSAGAAVSVITDKGEIPCAALILAPGHSARDTYRMLHEKGFSLQPKDFSVGARVEHLQEDIDRAMYGDADISLLGHAEYSLSMRSGDRGVYSFCMCPGGEVICASTEEGGLTVNGMSRYDRSGVNANSAIAVSVLKEDYGNDPMKAIFYQQSLERRAFLSAGGGFRAPVQTLGDFLDGTLKSDFSRVKPSFRNGEHIARADLSGILPAGCVELMRSGFRFFERQISGFSAPYAVLTGVETRTSAPLRILRGEALTAPGHGNVYPCGEGAGYAGGITSAAIDGIRAARAVISRYQR